MQVQELRRHLAAWIRPLGIDHEAGFSFSFNALAPVVPLWELPSSANDGDSFSDSLRDAFQELRQDGVKALLETWRERVSYRKDLRRLLVAAPHMINDIGLTLEQAVAESGRPFWRG